MSNVIATSTIDLIDLSRKVDEFIVAKDFFGQTIGWIIGIITIIIALFITIQWVYARRIEEKQLEKISLRIQQENERKIEVFLEERLATITAQIEQLRLSAEADIARLLALHSEQVNFYDKAFYWWLNAAVKFIKSDAKTSLIETCILSAEKALEKIPNGDINTLKEDLSDIERYVSELAEIHGMRMGVLRERLHKKLSPKDGV